MSGFEIKDGGFYRTRRGEKAEVLSYSLTRDCWLGFCPCGTPVAWHSDGRLVDRMAHEVALSGDLIALWTEPKKGAVWVNIFDHMGVSTHIWSSREAADRAAAEIAADIGHRPLACIQVNWTEGEGLS
jgi:hypothetical protein